MKKHIFLLVLTLVVAFSAGQLGYAQTSYATTITLDGQSIIKEKNGTSTTIGQGNSFQITDFEQNIPPFHIHGNKKWSRVLVKNGMNFVVRVPSNYTNIEKAYGSFTVHTDSQGTYLRFTGAGGFNFDYKTVVGGVQQTRNISGDVNYYGVLQIGESPINFEISAPEVAGQVNIINPTAIVVNNVNKQEHINMKPNIFHNNWWNVIVNGESRELYENKTSISMEEIFNISKDLPGFDGVIKLKVQISDGTSNGIRNNQGKKILLGRSYNTISLDFTPLMTINPTSIEVTQSQVNLTVGDNPLQITATVKPDTATDKELVWSSSNSTIVSVSQNGLISAHSPGNSTIKVALKNHPSIFVDIPVKIDTKFTFTTESHHPTWGTAQPATQTVNAGTEVTLQATPKTGYRFVGWAVGTPSFIVANDNPYQPAINENVRFIAVFEPLPLQITANSNNTAWGSVSPENQTLNAGQRAKVTATPVAPHKFKHWINTATQAVVSTQAEYSFTVNENSSLTAVFEVGVSTYKVTAKSNNTAWGSVSPENQTLNAGQTAKVTATPVAPHKFKHWVNTATQAVVSTQAEYSFTVNENSSLTAVFEEVILLDPNAVLPHLTGLDTAVLKTGTPQTFVWEDMPQNATNFKATLIDMSNASAVTALVSTIDATQAQLEFAKAGTFTLMIHFEVLGVYYTVSYDGIVVK
ncbi:Ig-like domain-containing protein [Capnocytophaga canimorsus]|uniref:InlB B-repeat-containing protein n=2 Tax=Capnocytophaga canimorsus TaxID=28188 RepID=UPI0037D6AC0B